MRLITKMNNEGVTIKEINSKMLEIFTDQGNINSIIHIIESNFIAMDI